MAPMPGLTTPTSTIPQVQHNGHPAKAVPISEPEDRDDDEVDEDEEDDDEQPSAQIAEGATASDSKKKRKKKKKKKKSKSADVPPSESTPVNEAATAIPKATPAAPTRVRKVSFNLDNNVYYDHGRKQSKVSEVNVASQNLKSAATPAEPENVQAATAAAAVHVNVAPSEVLMAVSTDESAQRLSTTAESAFAETSSQSESTLPLPNAHVNDIREEPVVTSEADQPVINDILQKQLDDHSDDGSEDPAPVDGTTKPKKKRKKSKAKKSTVVPEVKEVNANQPNVPPEISTPTAEKIAMPEQNKQPEVVPIPSHVPRSDFYQKPDSIVMNVYRKGLTRDNVSIDFPSANEAVVSVRHHSEDDTAVNGWSSTAYSLSLETPVNQKETEATILGTKLEVSFPKIRRGIWANPQLGVSKTDFKSQLFTQSSTEEVDLPELVDPTTIDDLLDPFDDEPPSYAEQVDDTEPTQTWVSLGHERASSYLESAAADARSMSSNNSSSDSAKARSFLEDHDDAVFHDSTVRYHPQNNSNLEDWDTNDDRKSPPPYYSSSPQDCWYDALTTPEKHLTSPIVSPIHSRPDSPVQSSDSISTESEPQTRASWLNFWSPLNNNNSNEEEDGIFNSLGRLSFGSIGLGFGDHSASRNQNGYDINDLPKQKLVKRSRGLVGLVNLGNTCFMNSTLQCLSAATSLVDYFLDNKYVEDINEENVLGMKGMVAVEFGRLLRRLWSAPDFSTAISPSQFKSTIARFRPQFEGSLQHDSQELLAFLLDGLHEDLNRVREKPYVTNPDYDGNSRDEEMARICWENYRKRNDSMVVDLFQGQYKSTIICQTCSKVSVTFDPFMYLSLPLPGPDRHWYVVISLKDAALPLRKTLVKLPEVESTAGNILRVVSERTHIPLSCLLLAEISFHRLARVMDSSSTIKLEADAELVAYEVSTTKFDDPETAIVPLLFNAYGIVPMRCAMCYRSKDLDDWDAANSSEKPEPLNLKRCPCKQVAYCSIDCQKQHRKVHKPNCTIQSTLFGHPRLLSVPRKNLSTTTLLSSAIRSLYPILEHDDVTEAMKNTNDHAGTSEKMQSLFKLHWTNLPDNFFNPTSSRSKEVEVDEAEPAEISNQVVGLLPTRALCLSIDRINFDKRRVREERLRDIRTIDDFSTKNDSYSQHDHEVPLSTCINMFLEREILDEDNAWYCPSCKKHQVASKQITLWSLPEVLVVHLKRFASGSSRGGFSPFSMLLRNKLTHFVSFPIMDFNLSGYLPQVNADGAIYDLFAVSNHFGGTMGGHYTAFTKRVDASGREVWFNFDDSNVSICSRNSIESNAAYVLFYRRRGQQAETLSSDE